MSRPDHPVFWRPDNKRSIPAVLIGSDNFLRMVKEADWIGFSVNGAEQIGDSLRVLRAKIAHGKGLRSGFLKKIFLHVYLL